MMNTPSQSRWAGASGRRPRIDRPSRIVLVEDRAPDVELLRLAFLRAGVPACIDVAPTGDIALARLRAVADGRDELPALVLLDLNLPGAGGDEILAEVRNHGLMARVPIIVLTTSAHHRAACMELGADGYIVKPNSFLELVAIVKQDLAPLLR